MATVQRIWFNLTNLLRRQPDDDTGLLGKEARSDDTALLDKEVRARITSCRGTQGECNCIGTALFIVGEKAKDSTGSPKYIYVSSLKDLKIITTPVIGCLVAWQYQEDYNLYFVIHMGVVTSVTPLRITSRHGLNGEFIEDEEFRIVNGIYNYYSRTGVVYYLPRALEHASRSGLS